MPIAPRPRLRLGGPRREPPPPETTDVTVTFPWCLKRGIDTRPQFMWGVLLAVRVARALALPSIAVAELGVAGGTHPPIGFLAFDLGYYSSTMGALGLLDAPAQRLLPRVGCFFDDVFGYAWSDIAGARAAIADWGAAHEQRTLAKIHGLRYSLPPSQDPLPWHEQMYLAHVLDHPDYAVSEGELVGGGRDAHRLER